jgi:hypothetical protein
LFWGVWGVWGVIKKSIEWEKKIWGKEYMYFFSHSGEFYLLPKLPKLPKLDNVVLLRVFISGDFCFSKLPKLPKSPQHTNAAWISTNIWHGLGKLRLRSIRSLRHPDSPLCCLFMATRNAASAL